jgi:hypothetical protein
MSRRSERGGGGEALDKVNRVDAEVKRQELDEAESGYQIVLLVTALSEVS